MEHELYHYGVKGMKWGVRRYQNKDGTLTPAGKKRLKKYENQLDTVNRNILDIRLMARNYADDPGFLLAESALSERVKRYSDRGERMVSDMKKKGLISDKITFREYTSKYETRVFEDCRKYISDRFDIKTPTDDDVNYFLEAYVCGAI